MEDARRSPGERGGVVRRRESLTRRFDTDQLDRPVVHERVKDSHRVRAATNARDHRLRQMTETLLYLLARFPADDRLEVPHHARIWRGADDAADHVVRALDR